MGRGNGSGDRVSSLARSVAVPSAWFPSGGFPVVALFAEGPQVAVCVGVFDAVFAEESDAAWVVVGYGCLAGAEGADGVPAEVVEAYAGPVGAV